MDLTISPDQQVAELNKHKPPFDWFGVAPCRVAWLGRGAAEEGGKNTDINGVPRESHGAEQGSWARGLVQEAACSFEQEVACTSADKGRCGERPRADFFTCSTLAIQSQPIHDPSENQE